MPGLLALSAVLLALAPDGRAAGEVGIFDPGGTVVRSLGGLDRPTLLVPWRDGTFLALEGGSRRLVERDLAGTVLWTASLPSGDPPALAAAAVSADRLLIALGREGLREMDRRGKTLWSAPSPLADAPVTGGVRLADGSTLAAVWNRRHRLFRFSPGGAKAEEISGLDLPEDGAALRIAAANPEASEVFVFEPVWFEILRVRLDGGALRVAERIDTRRIEPSRGIEQVVPDKEGGFAYVAEGFSVGRVTRSGAMSRFQTLFRPDGVLPAPEGRLFVAYTRVADLSWPEERPKRETNPALRMQVIGWWLAGGFLAAAALLFLGKVEGKASAPATSDRQEFAAVRGLGAQAGIAERISLVLVVAGSLVAAIAPWSESHRAGLWLAVLVLLVSLVFLSKKTPGAPVFVFSVFPSKKSPGGAPGPSPGPPFLQQKDFLWVLLPLAVGCVTIGYRLSDVPLNTHFDYTYYALSAWDLMQGRASSLWEFGFVPAPVFGLLPEVIGLALFGPGALGFRAGAALVGLSGIAAVYVLGTAYRDRKTGLLAAIFLAGGTPWIHFSRMSSTGEAATVALFTLALFAVALRTGGRRAFLLAGAAAGLGFYFWPAARTGIAACVLAGGILALRHPAAAWKNRRNAALMVLALAVFVAPLLRVWASGRDSAMPRAAESMTVWHPGEAVRWETVASSFGEPLRASALWFFRPGDNSTHGTPGPACNRVEAALLVAGFLLVLAEGFSLNVLLLAQLAVTLLVFGAWATSPPWSPRLLAAYPVAAVLIARALTAVVDLAERFSPRSGRLAFACAAAASLAIAPLYNFPRYLRFETGASRPGRAVSEMTAIGRRLQSLGPGWHAWLVTTGRPEWSLDLASRTAALGELLPFIWNLHVTEVRDLPARLPFPAAEKAAVVVPLERFDDDIATLRKAYPQARVEGITGLEGERLAGLVLIGD